MVKQNNFLTLRLIYEMSIFISGRLCSRHLFSSICVYGRFDFPSAFGIKSLNLFAECCHIKTLCKSHLALSRVSLRPDYM